jgi:hypothetical protein
MSIDDNFELAVARAHARPVADVLGNRTIAAIRGATRAMVTIVKPPAEHGWPRPTDYQCLACWRQLASDRLDELRAILVDPNAYWNGHPRYRRLPPRPDFAARLDGPGGVAVVLADLRNPGWQMFCVAERYWGFNFAGPRLIRIANATFPEHASPSARSVWRAGAIKGLGTGTPWPRLTDET